MKLLLARRGNWMQKDLEDMTPLHLTTRHKSPKCLALLLKHMAPGEVDTQDRNKVKILLIFRQLLILRFVATSAIGFTSISFVQKIIYHKVFLSLQSRNNSIFLMLMMSKVIALAPLTFFLRVVTKIEDSKAFKSFCNIVILVGVWIACAYVAFLPLKNFTFNESFHGKSD